jgi:P27 family predicted phage terminase small subunit
MSMTITAINGGDGLPPEPDWSQIFTDEFDLALAHGEWGIVTRELASVAVLSVANGHAIRRLVEFRVQYERSARHVAEKGAILAPTSKKAKTGQWNPHWSVMRQAEDAMRALEAELGLAPTRRAKAAKVQRGKATPRAADGYLRPRT